MYTQFTMREIQLVLVRNNLLDQYTSYNWPLLSEISDWHRESLKIFARMHQKFETHCQQYDLRERIRARQDFIILEQH